MSVRAVDVFRGMRGGSQSQLMLGEDGRLWVVKFQNNPQHIRVLANELLATRLAEEIGLSVPTTEIIDVPESFTASHPDMDMEFTRGRRERCLPGQHFGSAFMGGLLPGLSVDYLPSNLLGQVRNLREFAGILAFDKWTSNIDARQAVYYRTPSERTYVAAFIDQGFCFNAVDWTFLNTSPVRGVYSRDSVYAGVTGWESFEPWLSRIENMDFTTLWRIAEAVPPLWYGGDTAVMEQLLRQLLGRQQRVREFILAFRDSYRNPFPLWWGTPTVKGER